MNDPIVIVSIARTPMGGFQGALSSLSAPQTGSVAIRAAVERAGIPAEDVQEVLMGHVLPAGVGQAPTRQAALAAGLSQSTLCGGVSKVCGSGMKAVMLAHDLLAAGTNDVMVAGGMESMTNAPYLLEKARAGYRLGHGKVLDHMFLDGLEDAYFDKGKLMGTFAEQCADHYRFSREEQDEFAISSLSRANAAIENGSFSSEVESVTIQGRKGDTLVEHDEQPGNARPDKIPSLRPAFRKDGTVTPANSSSISDGAAARYGGAGTSSGFEGYDQRRDGHVAGGDDGLSRAWRLFAVPLRDATRGRKWADGGTRDRRGTARLVLPRVARRDT